VSTDRLKSMEEQLAYLQHNVNEISSALSAHESAIHSLASMVDNLQDSGSNASDSMVGKDRVWNCEKCNARLGVYDPDSEQLRIKYKDFSLYSVPGKGGSLTVPCRRCAHLNTLEDDR
jgi:uncharacterized coiled-coil protein SlyX